MGLMQEIEKTMKTANETVSPFGNKRDVAAMLKLSVRSVDNYIAVGCPVVKLSPRRCRFDLPEVREWFKNQYGQQRRRKHKDERDKEDEDKGSI